MQSKNDSILKFNIYIKFFVLLFCFNSYSQLVEPSAGVGKQMLQIEMEAQYAVQKEEMNRTVVWSLPSMLIRYGMSNNIELQINSPLLFEQNYEFDDLVEDSKRFSFVQIGASINLWKQNEIIPQSELMARVILPIKKDEDYHEVGKIVALNFSNTISKNCVLNYNLGFISEIDSSKSGYYILNLGCNLTNKWHCFIENFSNIDRNSKFSQNINCGGGYNVNNNFSLDFSIAKGLNYDFIYNSFRITWIMNTNKNNKN